VKNAAQALTRRGTCLSSNQVGIVVCGCTLWQGNNVSHC
jgi:hypothetical protein